MECCKAALKLMDSIPDQFKLRHMNTIQDILNHIALVHSQRDGEKNMNEALTYLNMCKDLHD